MHHSKIVRSLARAVKFEVEAWSLFFIRTIQTKQIDKISKNTERAKEGNSKATACGGSDMKMQKVGVKAAVNSL